MCIWLLDEVVYRCPLYAVDGWCCLAISLLIFCLLDCSCMIVRHYRVVIKEHKLKGQTHIYYLYGWV